MLKDLKFGTKMREVTFTKELGLEYNWNLKQKEKCYLQALHSNYV